MYNTGCKMRKEGKDAQIKFISIKNNYQGIHDIRSYLNGVSDTLIPIWFGYLGKVSAPIFFS